MVRKHTYELREQFELTLRLLKALFLTKMYHGIANRKRKRARLLVWWAKDCKREMGYKEGFLWFINQCQVGSTASKNVNIFIPVYASVRYSNI